MATLTRWHRATVTASSEYTQPHPAPPAQPGGNLQYHMTQLDSYAMTGNLNSFQHSAAAYRNGQEWSQQQRNSLTAQANAVARRRSTETRSLNKASGDGNDDDASDESDGPPSSETFADELALDVPAKRRRRPVSS